MKQLFSKTGIFVLIGFILVGVPSSILAQGLSAEQVAKIQSVSSALIAPDGDHIAYTVRTQVDPFEENAPANYELYVYDVAQETSRPYYTAGSVSDLSFRPEHSSLTFLTKREGDDHNALYELPLDGGAAVKLYQFDRSISAYDWNDSGDRLAFTSSDKAEESDNPLPYEAEVYEENNQQRRAYVVGIGDHDFHDNPKQLKVNGSVYHINWSPESERLAVAAAPTPAVDDYYMFQEISVADAGNGKVVAEINNEGKVGQVLWSPDGEQVALRAGADIHDPIDGRVLIVSAEGGTPEVIDEDYEGKYEEIDWTEEGIHFLASESTATVLGHINADGSGKEITYRAEEQAISSWSRAKDGSYGLVASTPEHPAELYRLEDASDDSPERLTHHNKWLDDIALGKQEVISYTPEDGKFEIEGIFIYPVNYEEGDEIPVITVVHGGPESHYSNGWVTRYSAPGQMAAGDGYGVFYPNYRGSTGRGEAFLKSSQADMAGKEFDDVVDGVDYLIDEGIADPDRIGVTGGSYGGYASGWMSTYYSERFAASVMFVGISNNISKWGTSDIPEELFLVHARERIWNDWMGFLKRSPVYYVDRAQTPILIMHGKEDPRVHPSQSLELYRHIKVRKPDLPLRLVWYPGEGHGNRNSTARYIYSLRMMRWFDTYLKTGNVEADKPGWEVPVSKKKKKEMK